MFRRVVKGHLSALFGGDKYPYMKDGGANRHRRQGNLTGRQRRMEPQAKEWQQPLEALRGKK